MNNTQPSLTLSIALLNATRGEFGVSCAWDKLTDRRQSKLAFNLLPSDCNQGLFDSAQEGIGMCINTVNTPYQYERTISSSELPISEHPPHVLQQPAAYASLRAPESLIV